MNLLKMSLIALAMGLGACSSNSDSSNNNGGTVTPAGGGGNPPAQSFDYKRFLYSTSGVCGKGGFYFRFLSASDTVIGKDYGHDIMVDSRILLYANGSFEVETTEKYILEYLPDGYKYRQQKSRYVSGQYREENGKLILGDLMELTGSEVGNRLVASILYKKNLMSPGLRGMTVSGNMVWSTAEIRSERETCPNDEDKLREFDQFKARANRSTTNLNSLATNEQVIAGSVTIKRLELILHSDGNYQVVARASVPDFAFDWSYIIDSGIWERRGSELKLNNGFVSLGGERDAVNLTFTRKVNLYTDDKTYPIDLTGRTFTLKYGASDLTTDDLTYKYR